MSDRYRFGPFEVDASEYTLSTQGRPVALTRRAFDTLLYLVRNPGRLVTREELLAAVWGETIVEEGNLHWTISAVRKALAQGAEDGRIETVRGLGYRFLEPVERVEEKAPEAISPATTQPLPLPPPRRLPRPLWLAGGLGALLLAIALVWTASGWLDNASASKVPGVAVVGFRNLSPGGTGDWVGTAMSEMLAADLGQGSSLRLVPSDDVASMRRDLGQRMDGPMGPRELAQIHRRLGSDWVVVGSYLLLEGQDPPLRVDVLLRHTGTGETRATLSRRGREKDLFALSSSLAGELREALGKPLKATDEKAAASSMPADPAVQRLYAEGLDRLRRRDVLAAVERLEAATTADPAFPGSWLALAQSYELLGADRKAEDAALKALQRSGGLPERQRLAAEAACLRAARRLPEAVDRLRRLYELSRHELEDGLALAEARIRAGQRREAQATLAELRKEHPADREDARLAVLEVDALHALEDFRGEIPAAEHALQAARRQGMAQIEIHLLSRLAVARIRAGSHADCRPALGDLELARRKAEALGDRFLLASILQNLGAAADACEDSVLSEQAARQAIALFRAIGAQGSLPPVLFNLGSSRLDQGDLLTADSLMREALETCEENSTLCRERFLHPIGVNRLHRGELAEARRMLEEGIQRNLALGNRHRVAEARGFLPDLAFWSGDPARAVELQRQVLALRQEIGIPRGIASARTDLAAWLAEAGRGAEAVAEARQALALNGGMDNASACALCSLAQAEFAAGDLPAADRESARAITLLPPPKKPFCSLSIWKVRAQVLLARKQLDAAGPLIDQGLALARAGGFVTYELQGRLFQAELALARGRSAEARELAAELAAEARAKGLGIIAQGCEAVIARAKKQGKPE